VSRARWREAVEALRTLCPVRGYEVRVYRCRIGDGCDGYVKEVGKRRLAVRVSRTLDEPFALEVLVHEWAHAMTWRLEHDRAPSHSAYWGLAYADAYRAVFNPKE